MAAPLFLIITDPRMALRFHRNFVPGTAVRQCHRITAHNNRHRQERDATPGTRSSIRHIDPGEESMAAALRPAPYPAAIESRPAETAAGRDAAA
jgi:hypothetical protein